MHRNVQEEKNWLEDGLISEEQFKKMEAIRSGKIFSIFWELQFALYVGVVLLTTGIGILIYKYIGSLGHILAILALTAGCAWSYYYLLTKAPYFSKGIVEAPNAYFDYVTLLSALLLSLTITYIEVQFAWFDPVWTYIPLFLSLVYFVSAYRFDHKGVLALAFISLASFLGLNIQPDLLKLGEVMDSLIYSQVGIGLGIVLAAAGLITAKYGYKAHFKAIYMNFATWLILGSSVAGMFDDGPISLYGIIGLLASAACLYYSWIEKSSWFAVYGSLLGYFILTAMLIEAMTSNFFEIAWVYFMFSPIAPILLIVHFNKAFKK